MNETSLSRAIRDAVSRTGRATLWRNNVGVDVMKGVAYGLGKGSADLVGFVHDTGRFFALEIKVARGVISDEQRTWVAFVNGRGGYAAVVRSIDESLAALDAASTVTTP